MSLLWMEGFDWATANTFGTPANDLLTKHYMFASFGAAGSSGIVANPNIDRPGNGLRFGSGHFIRTNKLRLTGPSTSNVCVIGFFLTTPPSILNNNDWIRVYSQDIVQFTIETNSDGTIDLNRGTSTVIATSSFAFATSNDYYVEFKVVIDDSAGSIEMRIADLTAGDTDTKVEFTATSLDTRASTTSDMEGWDQVQFLNIGNPTLIDDIYILDGAGSSSNDFLGNSIVQTLDPTAEGENTDFTPSTGSDNSAMVDELAPTDDDGTYNESTVNGDTDTYVLADAVGELIEIPGVMVTADIRVTGATPRIIRLPVKSGATTSEGDDISIGNDAYRGRSRILETDPNTASPWSANAIDALEAGVKRQG